MSPRVTVLMPVYNGEAHLRQAMDSILGQSFDDFEFLIIDDGSTDGTKTIVESYLDARIRLIKNETNIGVARSLNKGLELATGEYISRMDADDISSSRRLAKQVCFMDTHPDTGICGSRVATFGASRNQTWKSPTKHEHISAELLFENCIAHPSVIIRKSCLTELSKTYDPEMQGAEDYDLWVRLFRQGVRLANLSDVLLKRREHGRQVGRVQQTAQLETSGQVRYRQLISLGLAPTPHELEVHEAVSNLRSENSNISLGEIAGWVKKLVQANRGPVLYNQSSLERAIASRLRRKAALSARSYLQSRDLPKALGVVGTMARIDKGWFPWLPTKLLAEPLKHMPLRGK